MLTLATVASLALPLCFAAIQDPPQNPQQPAGATPTGPEQLFVLRWSVDKLGRTLASPAVDGSKEPTPLFGRMGSAEGLDATVGQGGIFGYVSQWMTGPRDFASQTDAEWHFRRLGLGLKEEELRARIASPPELDNPHLQRRAELDRLLAVRLAGQFGLAGLQPDLARLAADEGSPWDLRRAASEASLAVVGQPAPSPVHQLVPLASALAAMPAEPSLLVVIRQDRVGDTGWILPRARPRTAALWRKYFADRGTAPDAASLGEIQRGLERTGELPYEMARQFGNWHALRSVVAMQIGRRDGRNVDDMAFCLDGRFEPEHIAAGLKAEQLEVHTEGGVVQAVLAPHDVKLSATPTRLLLQSATIERTPAPQVELGDAAVLLQLRKLPRHVLPPIGQADLVTLRLWMVEDFRVELTVDCVSQAFAGDVAAVVNDTLAAAAALVGLDTPAGTVLSETSAVIDDQRVTMEVRSEDLSFEIVMGIFMELGSR